MRAAVVAIAAAGLGLAFLTLRCKVGVHGPAVWEFVGSSWDPDLYVRVCGRCGDEMPSASGGAS